MASRSSTQCSTALSRAWFCVAVSLWLVACSSTVAKECAEEAENLTIRTAADVELAREIGSVSGEVGLIMDPGEVGPRDLSFLGCLASAESILIYEAPELETTAGAAKLTHLGSLRVANGDSLRVIEGFDGVEEIEKISVDDLPVLASIDLPHLEHAGSIEFGVCGIPPGYPNYSPFNPALVEIGPFESLRDLDFLLAMGNSALTSLSVLDSLRSNGAPPLRNWAIGNNPKLSQVEVDQDLAALGATPAQLVGACGNLGTEETVCKCPWGE